MITGERKDAGGYIPIQKKNSMLCTDDLKILSQKTTWNSGN